MGLGSSAHLNLDVQVRGVFLASVGWSHTFDFPSGNTGDLTGLKTDGDSVVG